VPKRKGLFGDRSVTETVTAAGFRSAFGRCSEDRKGVARGRMPGVGIEPTRAEAQGILSRAERFDRVTDRRKAVTLGLSRCLAFFLFPPLPSVRLKSGESRVRLVCVRNTRDFCSYELTQVFGHRLPEILEQAAGQPSEWFPYVAWMSSLQPR